MLTHSTGYPRADNVMRGIVALFETIYPQRIIGYYVDGSYADQTAVATSDLDLTIVFATPFATMAEQEHAHRIVAACAQISALELDVLLSDEQQLRQHADPMFKLGARLLYGRDMRDTIPLIPIMTWARHRMHAAYWLMINVFRRPQPVRAPLAFPQPGAPFYGYTDRMMRLPDGTEIPTTRNLIRVTGWIATARIAYQTGQYVVRKHDCVPSYRHTINDEWTALLEQIDQRCRTAWQYRIPDGVAEQAELGMILKQTLAFENHFLTLYRQFLILELTSDEPATQRMALQVLDQTVYADSLIMHAIQPLITAEEPEIQAIAHKLVQQMVIAGAEDTQNL